MAELRSAGFLLACCPYIKCRYRKRSHARYQAEQQEDCTHTLAGGIQRTHVEDVDALHLTDELETLETGSLEVVGRDGTGLGTRRDQVILVLDLCSPKRRSD